MLHVCVVLSLSCVVLSLYGILAWERSLVRAVLAFPHVRKPRHITQTWPSAFKWPRVHLHQTAESLPRTRPNKSVLGSNCSGRSAAGVGRAPTPALASSSSSRETESSAALSRRLLERNNSAAFKAAEACRPRGDPAAPGRVRARSTTAPKQGIDRSRQCCPSHARLKTLGNDQAASSVSRACS